jgi:hypothetical protein
MLHAVMARLARLARDSGYMSWGNLAIRMIAEVHIGSKTVLDASNTEIRHKQCQKMVFEPDFRFDSKNNREEE